MSGVSVSSPLGASPAMFYQSNAETTSQGFDLETLNFAHWATGCGDQEEGDAGCAWDFANVFDSHFFSTAGQSLCGFALSSVTALTLGQLRWGVPSTLR